MKSGILLLENLQQEDVDWLFQMANIKAYAKNDTILHENELNKNLFILLKGSAHVITSIENKTCRLAEINPGDTLGEISFISHTYPIAAIVAQEECSVLAISYDQIHARCEQVPSFGERFYQSISLVLAKKLKKLNYYHAQLSCGKQVLTETQAANSVSTTKILPDELKELHDYLEQVLYELSNVKILKADKKQLYLAQLQKLFDKLQQQFQVDSLASYISYKRLRQYLMPYMLQSEFAKICLQKPKAMYSNYHLMEILYAGVPKGENAFQLLIDEFFLSQLPMSALRKNFRKLEQNLLTIRKQRTQQKLFTIASLFNGPNFELFHLLNADEHPKNIVCDIYTIDKKISAILENRMTREHVSSRINFMQTNIVNFSLSKIEYPANHYDIFYSFNALEMLDEHLIQPFLHQLYDALKPQGVALIVFLQQHPYSHFLLKGLLRWDIYTPSADSLLQHIKQSEFATSKYQIESDPDNLCAILKITK
ncbi:MAG: hypothetical protein Tsb005_16180 [Gammaproteobacteria bacterium]